MKKDKQKLTLDRPVTYQIKVPGELDEKWLDWNAGMKIMVESDSEGFPITTLSITVDQAALQGLLRYLYSMGLPLVSAVCVDLKNDEEKP
jgi:hypothetical protein